MVSIGCSGSTFLMGVARRLLVALGGMRLPRFSYEFELLNPRKNPLYNGSHASLVGRAAATALAIEAAQAQAVMAGGSTLVYIAAPGCAPRRPYAAPLPARPTA